MLQPFEPEESSWALEEWPFTRSLFPSMRQFFPTSGLSVWEEKDEVVVETALPGIKTGEVELTFERGVLTVHAQKKEEKESKDRKYFQKSSSSFLYRLNVPGELDETEEPQAKLNDGVLTVRFKKHKRATPRKINIQE